MKKLVLFLFITGSIMISACKDKSTTAVDTNYTSSFNAKVGMEVIQFHSEHRCQTCVKIEEQVLKAIKPYGNLPFKLVNVDDNANDDFSKIFEASGTALFLYDAASGKKVELTDFAFMNAFEDEKFIKGLQKEIDQF